LDFYKKEVVRAGHGAAHSEGRVWESLVVDRGAGSSANVAHFAPVAVMCAKPSPLLVYPLGSVLERLGLAQLDGVWLVDSVEG